jgi:mono/diheme cytochrome c family protein
MKCWVEGFGRAALLAGICVALASPAWADAIGEERSGYERLEDGEERALHLNELLRRGKLAFEAQWTPGEGGGRPLTTGTGAPIADDGRPLEFPHNFNRVSARDANGCAGCHNAPFGIPGGGGDFVTGVFVAAQRFDFASFDHGDAVVTRGAVSEDGTFATLENVGNYRATVGMFGSGLIEMLARQMTADLRSIRDGLAPGGSAPLTSKGIDFGELRRLGDGSWDTAAVEGLPPQSLASSGPGEPPSLVIHPFHQSGSVVSIRQFTNNAFNHHHGMQSAERFGAGVDADGDGIVNELTVADITAVTLYQAILPVPQQVLPTAPKVRQAIEEGEVLFNDIGCGGCHVPALPLVDEGWIYTEPNPYNPAGNLQPGEGREVAVDLSHSGLPGERPKPQNGVLWVRAFTDLKLHDITTGPGDPNEEAININHPAGSPEFLGGNREFLTKKLWGAANERPYFHHGKFTTLREATLAHDGEARDARLAFEALDGSDQDRVIEFLKSLQVVPPQGL